MSVLHDMHEAVKATKKLREQIVAIANAFDELLSTGIREDTLITLLHAQTKIAKRDIKKLLFAMKSFRKTHLKE